MLPTIENTDTQALIDTLELYPNITPIFDLDGVILNAGHRIPLNEDGSLNLDEYRKLSTRDNILNDKTMPLFDVVEWLNKEKRPYLACTARVICEHNRELFRSIGFKPRHIMSRDGEHDARKDYHLKTAKISAYLSNNRSQKANDFLFLDDCAPNVRAIQKLGVPSLHVIKPVTIEPTDKLIAALQAVFL